ncbi:amino acid deaminase/aldolase [Nakamurella lactea]|uniref:amino acid deaminase/aldolase n=1 Tax=Nakamurella lactea TaxID=459515 RepID=UPI0006855097
MSGSATRWATPPELLRQAVSQLTPPFGVLDDAALRANAADLVRRAAGKPIRLATKSVRIRSLIRRTVDTPGFAGLLAYTLPEAVWLHGNGFDDIVVGYPTADRDAVAELADTAEAAAAITVMIDDPAQLDLIDAVRPPGSRPTIRVCIELDAGYRPAAGLHLGAFRSPVHTPSALVALARTVHSRAGFELVGIMAYEGQIAGVGNAGRGPRARVVRAMQRRSAAELAGRRSAAVAAVRDIADLEFVNGGGTGSLETTAAEDAVTEVAAGSGLLGPGLFDHYRAFRPSAASFFVLPVVRRPARRVATLAGGGWIASGPPGADRLPVLADPPGLRYLAAEAAGEVQTPVRGRAAGRLRVGDQVWLRHAKSGEPAEHLQRVHLVADGAVTETWPTYRGEGQVF